MKTIGEAAQRVYPGQGHDRVYLNEELGIYAVFDGAGIALPAEFARTVVDKSLARGLPRAAADHLPAYLMNLIHTKLCVRIGKYPAYTTGTIVQIPEAEPSEILYAGAADSLLYVKNGPTAPLEQITQDEEYLHRRSNWLGSPRFKLEQQGRLTLNDGWQALIVSDGVNRARNGGLSIEAMDAIMSTQTVGVAQAIVDAVRLYDDATTLHAKAAT